MVVANPARVRDFAKGHGYFEKSDKIDARMLQLYGQQVKVSLAKPRTGEERHFIALSRRRTQLLQLVSQESNRLRQCLDTQTNAFVKEMLKLLVRRHASENPGGSGAEPPEEHGTEDRQLSDFRIGSIACLLDGR